MDYYALLGIPRKASAEAVRAAYKREGRIWRKQAIASSEGSVKDEAKKRLALLAEAFGVLSDAQKRALYDRQPISAPIESPSSLVPVEMASRDWIEQAEGYLAVADYQAAARAAREATANLGNSAQSWFVLSRAKAGLRQLDDAVYEARRAIELAPKNSMYHFNLGTIYEELGRWDEALNTYEHASQLEPTEPLYQLAIGGVWLQNGQLARAMPIIERVYSTLPDDETACFYYAQGLIAMAEAVPKDKSTDGYAVTRAEEIQEIRGYLSRAAGIKHLDQETKQVIRDTEAYLHRMEANTFHIPLGARSAAFELIGPGLGCYGTLIMGTMLAVLALAPLLLLLWGFGLLTSGSIGGGFIALLISAGLGYLWYRAIWVPRWKVNARMRDHRIRYLS
jgi:tetratricopeptide (TPR) repeat protein